MNEKQKFNTPTNFFAQTIGLLVTLYYSCTVTKIEYPVSTIYGVEIGALIGNFIELFFYKNFLLNFLL